MNLKGNTLTAVMDLILDYPVDHAAFIGFFYDGYVLSEERCRLRDYKCGFTVTDETQYIFMELTL